jgi:hypothetical protein
MKLSDKDKSFIKQNAPAWRDVQRALKSIGCDLSRDMCLIISGMITGAKLAGKKRARRQSFDDSK